MRIAATLRILSFAPRAGLVLCMTACGGGGSAGPALVDPVDPPTPAPTVTAIALDTGSTNGNQAVTITGTGFVANDAGVNVVSFGPKVATAVVTDSDTTITCITPGGVPGPVDVSVSNANGTGTRAAGFTYVVPSGPIYRDAHPRIYLERNHSRLAAAVTNQTTAATRFKGMVDRWVGGDDIYDFQSWWSALLWQLTGQTSYRSAAVSAVDAFVASEEALVSGGDRPQVAFDSYLEVGPIVGDVMLVYDWCFDALSASQRTRWLAYANQAIWNVWHPDDAVWGGNSFPWSGWSIDNPSNNYYYSFLRATMLFGLAAHGEHAAAFDYLDFFRVTKIEDQLVPTFESDLVGGGSREGTGYGTAMMRLFELYDLWQGSTGENIADLTSHTRASLLHMFHAVVPTLDRLAPTGDHSRDSTAALFDYHRHYVQLLAALYPNDRLAPRARYFLSHSSVPTMSQQFMWVYDFLYDGGTTATSIADLGRAYYASGPGELYNRSSWDTNATWVNLIAGPYTESHAHQDQGSLMFYKGEWLAYDPNIESHSGIYQEVQAHNLVKIVDGGTAIRQWEGTTSSMLAVHRGTTWLHAAADLTAAYDGDSRVQGVQREIVHLEPDVVVVFDRVQTSASTQQVWQLSSPVSPTITGGKAVFQGASHSLTVQRLLPAGATATKTAWTSIDSDFNAGHRFQDTIGGGTVNHLHVLWADAAVSSVAASDADGRLGVIVHFANGSQATVRFSTGGVDGTLELRNSAGTVTDSATLGEGIEELPE